MAEQLEMSIDEHDRLMAYVLGLSHALNLAFFTALAESGELVPRLQRMSSTTFDAQLKVASLVATDNPHLYFEIQALNDYGAASLQALRAAAERIQQLVESARRSGLRGTDGRRSPLSRESRLNAAAWVQQRELVTVESQDREVIELRRRIAGLRDEAKRNEDAWKRSQQREMELLEADTLPILLERLTHGLQQSYRLDGRDARARGPRPRNPSSADGTR